MPSVTESYMDDLAGSTFPINAIEVIAHRFELIDIGLNVVRRVPDTSDSTYTVAVYAVDKQFAPETAEIRGPQSFAGPTVTPYLIRVSAFVKDAKRERGMSAHSALAEIVEHILVDDPALRAGLGLLTSNVMGTIKSVGRFYPVQTRYLSNDLDGSHLFLSTTDSMLEAQKTSP